MILNSQVAVCRPISSEGIFGIGGYLTQSVPYLGDHVLVLVSYLGDHVHVATKLKTLFHCAVFPQTSNSSSH